MRVKGRKEHSLCLSAVGLLSLDIWKIQNNTINVFCIFAELKLFFVSIFIYLEIDNCLGGSVGVIFLLEIIIKCIRNIKMEMMLQNQG